jgi:hypothetical protein
MTPESIMPFDTRIAVVIRTDLEPWQKLNGRFINSSGASRREDTKLCQRHCERSEAIHSFFAWHDGLLRWARNDGS